MFSRIATEVFVTGILDDCPNSVHLPIREIRSVMASCTEPPKTPECKSLSQHSTWGTKRLLNMAKNRFKRELIT